MCGENSWDVPRLSPTLVSWPAAFIADWLRRAQGVAKKDRQKNRDCNGSWIDGGSQAHAATNVR